MSTVIDDLLKAVDGLSELDASRLDDIALDKVLVAVEHARNRLGAAAERLVGEWDAREVWARDGSLTAPARLARAIHTSPRAAAVTVRRARELREMADTAGEYTKGRLSAAHVDLLARARHGREHLFGQYEAALVEVCARLRFSQAEQALAQWAQLVDASGVEAEGQALADGARLYCSPSFEGMTRIDGWLDPVGGEVIGNELRRLADLERRADQACGRRRTPAQLRAAALVVMAARSAGAPGGSRKPLFTVAMGDDTFRGLCRLAAGTQIAPGQLVPWLSDAEIQAVLFEGRWRAVSVSSRRRFGDDLRRVISVRDQHCQHAAGCDAGADGCDVDHVQPWSMLHLTSQENGRLLCRTHNRHADKRDHPPPPPPSRPVTAHEHLATFLLARMHTPSDDDGH